MDVLSLQWCLRRHHLMWHHLRVFFRFATQWNFMTCQRNLKAFLKLSAVRFCFFHCCCLAWGEWDSCSVSHLLSHYPPLQISDVILKSEELLPPYSQWAGITHACLCALLPITLCNMCPGLVKFLVTPAANYVGAGKPECRRYGKQKEDPNTIRGRAEFQSPGER